MCRGSGVVVEVSYCQSSSSYRCPQDHFQRSSVRAAPALREVVVAQTKEMLILSFSFTFSSCCSQAREGAGWLCRAAAGFRS